MKKLITTALLTFSIMSNAQFREYFTVSLAIDPTATVKEKSPNVVLEVEYYQKWLYVKASTQVLPALQGGYFDYGGGAGLNINLGMYEKTRLYAGGRLGVIRRGGYGYPLAGAEAGINHYVSENVFIGLRATLDHRTDFKYWGGTPENRLSTFIRIGTNF